MDSSERQRIKEKIYLHNAERTNQTALSLACLYGTSGANINELIIYAGITTFCAFSILTATNKIEKLERSLS